MTHYFNKASLTYLRPLKMTLTFRFANETNWIIYKSFTINYTVNNYKEIRKTLNKKHHFKCVELYKIRVLSHFPTQT